MYVIYVYIALTVANALPSQLSVLLQRRQTVGVSIYSAVSNGPTHVLVTGAGQVALTVKNPVGFQATLKTNSPEAKAFLFCCLSSRFAIAVEEYKHEQLC